MTGPQRRPWPGENASIGQHLAYLRARAGFTVVAFSEACGWGHYGARRINRFERGQSIPNAYHLRDMAAALNITTARLVDLLWIDPEPPQEHP